MLLLSENAATKSSIIEYNLNEKSEYLNSIAHADIRYFTQKIQITSKYWYKNTDLNQNGSSETFE